MNTITIEEVSRLCGVCPGGALHRLISHGVRFVVRKGRRTFAREDVLRMLRLYYGVEAPPVEELRRRAS